VSVEVADDGVGGASMEQGSGLRGLQDRLGTVGGALEVRSDPGAGTRLCARIPLSAASA
jgi:signal transduction histidine kinase